MGAGGNDPAEAAEGGARVVLSARRVLFHLASSYPLQERFRSVLERIMSRAMPARAGVG
jgi:hypothetical protein